jgi:hypothetical protein
MKNMGTSRMAMALLGRSSDFFMVKFHPIRGAWRSKLGDNTTVIIYLKFIELPGNQLAYIYNVTNSELIDF